MGRLYPESFTETAGKGKNDRKAGVLWKWKQGGSSFVRTTPVKTGDDTEILFWLLLGGAALFAGGLVIRKGGRT